MNKEFSKFYTKKEVVKLCCNEIKKNISINKEDLFIEPSAGNGAFISPIKELTNNYVFYDIKPEHKEITEKDFLSLEIKNEENKKIHIIGNPPFGKQNNLVIKFIKHCCKFSDTISFILPKSFKKQSLQKYFNEYYHLEISLDLPDKSFLLDNKEYHVPCIFQIWIKKDYKRIEYLQLYPLNFIFVKKTGLPDFSVRRVGWYAGTVDKNYTLKNIQSHYFIKLINKEFNVDKVINLLNNIEWEFNNSVGSRSISKQELIKNWNPILENL